MFITGLGTALPEKRFTQAECWEALQTWDNFHRLTPRSCALLRKVIGNISSPFVYHVLERALAHRAPGGLWWMSSFGAGFSCHGALLAVE